jgi:hypothetical protein
LLLKKEVHWAGTVKRFAATRASTPEKRDFGNWVCRLERAENKKEKNKIKKAASGFPQISTALTLDSSTPSV